MGKICLLVLSGRPAIRNFFGSISDLDPEYFQVRPLSVSPSAVIEFRMPVYAKPILALDIGHDANLALRACRAFRAQISDLPTLAVICCMHAIAYLNLQVLVNEGISGILDLNATPEESLRVIRAVADGGMGLNVQLPGGSSSMLALATGGALSPKDLMRGWADANSSRTRLISLVAAGMSDQEIGQALNLSRHTVHHKIERCCRTLRVRNRTELAAWAGRNGFYDPDHKWLDHVGDAREEVPNSSLGKAPANR